MARKLKTIAEWINGNSDEYRAYITEGYCNTDRKISGTRLRHPGKGRYGKVISIFHCPKKRKGMELVFTHNSAETYRTNDEVEGWVKANITTKQGGSI